MRLMLFVFSILAMLPFCMDAQLENKKDKEEMKTKSINIGERKILLTTLNKKETKDVIHSFHGKKNMALSKQFDSEAFNLSDGRFILSHEGGGALYASQKDLEDLMKFLHNNEKAHPLLDGLPYDVNYLTHIDAIINEFSTKLKIDKALLNKSPESLKIIESKLKDLKIDEFTLEKEYLIYLMTYCGEVIREKVGGNWTLLNLSIGNKTVYEPIIRVSINRDYSPLWPLLKEINERPTNFSLVIAIESEIEKYKLMDVILKQKN